MADPADILRRIGFGYAVLGRDAMRARAYTNAARIVRKFGSGLEQAYRDGSLGEVRGIGKSILGVVGAVLDDEPVAQLDKLRDEIPEGVFAMRHLRGIGPAKIKVLWQDLGLASIAELEYACNENRLVEQPGFGAKTQRKVLDAIAATKTRASRVRMDRARAVAAELVAALQADDGVQRAEIVGQVRRGTELVDCVEVAVLGAPSFEVPQDADGLPVVVHPCADAERWGAHLVTTTGSAGHLAKLRETGELRGSTEARVYRALGFVMPAPERREGHVPLLKLGQAPPELVRPEELRGVLHNHTTESDGIHSLEEMRAAATRLGLEYLGISDHSQSAGYAGGLQPLRLITQVGEIAQLNAMGDGGCHVFSGVESDILRDGRLDYDPHVLAELDVVVASVHNRGRLDRKAMTERMLRAARDPWTDVIGHPTGRLLLGRAGSDFDLEAVLDACADSGCAMELNANPQRLDLDEFACAAAKERGIPISISADAHSTAAIGHIEYGVTIARRAGLRAEDILNCRTLEQLEDWLEARKARALAVGSL